MAPVNSRESLKQYALRALGAPVIEINVDDEQLEDRIDEALSIFQEYNSDAYYRGFFKHQITQTDLNNGYIDISGANILYVKKMFAIKSLGVSRSFFDVKYQMHLNDLYTMRTTMGDLAYYEQMQQYLSLIDMKLNGTPQIDFVYNQDRIYVHGDFVDGDIIVGDWIVVEAYFLIDPDTYPKIWNEKWLKSYTIALFKRQWGLNMMKFEGLQMPGGVMFNGRQYYDDAVNEIEQLKTEIREEHELPADFSIG